MGKARYTFYGRDYPVRLVEMLPLSGPLSLHIDPANLCNLKCAFCPTGHPDLLKKVGRPRGMMDEDLFTKVIRDLGAFPQRLQRLHLYKDGEPLLNPALGRLIEIAASGRVSDSVELTTNGLLLTPQHGIDFAKAGLDRIRVSVYGTNADYYRRISGRAVDYSEIVQHVKGFVAARDCVGAKPSVHVKLLDWGLTQDDRERFLSDFGTIADEVHVDSLMGWTHTSLFDFRLGRDHQHGMNPAIPNDSGRQVCPLPFYTMAVNVDGSVSACCVDWSHSALIGDVRRQSLLEIWEGAPLKALRILHLTGRRCENSACNECDYVKSRPAAADLDASAERLTLVYRSRR
jgi:radical SAM protein with 4Fe4S-binding SPASM domain